MLADIEQKRAAIEEACSRYGVQRLEVFGSAIREDFRQDSDVDFLVEFEMPRRPGYFKRFFGLQETLARILGRPVDLVVDSAIKNSSIKTATLEAICASNALTRPGRCGILTTLPRRRDSHGE